MIKIELFDFQKDAVLNMLDYTTNPDSKQNIILKAPTGSGKTVMLIDFIDKYLENVNSNCAFVWLCPGKGNLEEQSYNSMLNIAPSRDINNLFDSLNNGFTPGTTTFINWELITKKGNKAITPGEKKNLYDQIDAARKEETEFMLIIDEEHSNKTEKAADIINYINPRHIIRVSATPKKNAKCEFLEIDEQEVINAGLITKAIYVNDGLADHTVISDDYNALLPLADQKRIELRDKFKKMDLDINPLVIIQFPNGDDEYVEAVLKSLDDLGGYTTDSGQVSIWMSGRKEDIPDNLTDNNGRPIFLLMKQAISTGWDCPRAKILVKLRENMGERFTIQTIGRIRRMPERRHYGDEGLDYSFVYTLDEKFKEGMLSELDKAYERRRLFLKDKCKDFMIAKENRDLDYDGLGAREVTEIAYNHFVSKYSLTDDKKSNVEKLSNHGFVFGDVLHETALQGKVAYTEQVGSDMETIHIEEKIDTHKHGIRMLHSRDEIKKIIRMSSSEVKTMLARLFKKGQNSKFKITSLTNREFYAFIINNIELLKEEFKVIVKGLEDNQAKFFEKHPEPRVSDFKIPVEDLLKFDVGVKDEKIMESNAYDNYTTGFVTDTVRSKPEIKFEKFCDEHKDSIDWVYKNGDKGQEYMSVVYVDGVFNQSLFYPDYILKTKAGDVWIIETKGGERGHQSQNIDNQAQNKFNAFAHYAELHDIKWGFVRDKDERLYINNTEFTEDMSTDNWIPLEDELK